MVCPASSCRLDIWNDRKLLQNKCQHTRGLACVFCSIAAACITSRKPAFPCTNLHGMPSRSRHHVNCILNSLAKRCRVLCNCLQIVAKLQQNAKRPWQACHQVTRGIMSLAFLTHLQSAAMCFATPCKSLQNCSKTQKDHGKHVTK